MSTPVRQQDVRIDPVAVFIARAEARALLYAAGELSLHESVDKLQTDAERDGLVATIGQDAVQTIMAAALAAVRDDSPLVPDELSIDDDKSAAGVPIATLHAAEYLAQRVKNPERLKTWLAKHSREEREAIRLHLRNKRGRSCR
jgi:hypothetical protein